jgi:hypothetical protein
MDLAQTIVYKMLIIINISWDENKYIVGTLALHGVVL